MITAWKSHSPDITGPPGKYVGAQDIFILPKGGDDYEDMPVEGIDSWAFVNPMLKTVDGKRNNKRITDIIDAFLKYSCKLPKLDQNITELYHLVSGKSNKFWEITYNPSIGGVYTVRFGKVGSQGRTTNKTGDMASINKLIVSKIEKGYVKIANKRNQKTVVLGKSKVKLVANPGQKKFTTGCTKRNPFPPCKNGYYTKKNKKGVECCYKEK